MKKNKKTFKPKRFCGAFLVVMYILVILLPFYSMLLISIVPESQYLQDNVLLYPKSITWEAYQFVFGGGINLARNACYLTCYCVWHNL